MDARFPPPPPPVPPLLAAAGLALVAYGYSKLTRDPRFFAGKVVVISGRSRGLGLVIARQLFAEGATVALLARDAAELERAAGELTMETTPTWKTPQIDQAAARNNERG